MMKLKRRHIFLILILIWIFLNISGAIFSYKADLSIDKTHSLSKISKQILQEIEDPLIFTLYFSENLHPKEKEFAEKLKALLQEYREEASTDVYVEVINPNENSDTELAAMNAGIKVKQRVDNRGEGDLKIRKIYMGMSIQVGAQSETIPVMSFNTSQEHLITSTLNNLTKGRDRIAYIQGHGEPPLEAVSDVVKGLGFSYDLVVDSLNQYFDPSQYSSLIIIAPFLQFTDEELQKLDDFLALNKHIFLAINRVDWDEERGKYIGYEVKTRLENWLVSKGVIINNDFIVDKNCATIELSLHNSSSTNNGTSFPYFPIITQFDQHPVTKGLDAIVLKFASSIMPAPNSKSTFTSLAETSTVAGKKQLPVEFDIRKSYRWGNSNYLFPKETVAALLEDNLNGLNNKAKMIVVSDGDFLINGIGEAVQQLNPGNIALLINAMDYLSSTPELLTLKTKGIYTFDSTQETENTHSYARYFFVTLPLLIVLLIALFNFKRRKYKRDSRMKEITNS